MAGFGWIILRVYFEGTIHTIIVTGSFVLLTVFSTFIVPGKFDYMERKEGGHGTFIFTSTMFIMALISFFVPSCFGLIFG